MSRDRYDFIELTYEYPLNLPPPKSEDYFLIPMLTAKEMGLEAAMFTSGSSSTRRKRELVNGVAVFTFDSTRAMIKQLIESAPALVHGHSFGWIPSTIVAPFIAKRYVMTPHVYRLDIYPSWKVTAALSMLKKADALITLTRFEKSQFTNIIDESKIHVIPHPVDYDFFSKYESSEKETVFQKYELNKSDKIVLCVANLVPRKNLETLILSFAKVKKKFPRSKLLLVGDEPKTILSVSTPKKLPWNYRSKLTKLASSLGVADDVIFAGHQKMPELRGFYAAADVFCLPSKVEGQVLAAGEAASSGIPLVLSNLEPLVELYNGCALFHGPLDYEQLANHIILLLENAELAKTLGDAGQIQMLNYRPEIVRAKLRELYEKVLS
jgi:glycosyltransferase involved in cell wall biosynthesis